MTNNKFPDKILKLDNGVESIFLRKLACSFRHGTIPKFFARHLSFNTIQIYWGDGALSKGINKEIMEQLKKEKKAVVDKVDFEDNVAVGIEDECPIEINGNVGDFFGALNSGGKLYLNGSAGRFAGNMMCHGEIVIDGSVGDGIGFGLYGGTIVVRGDAGNKIGQMNKGGTIIVHGSVRDNVGLYSLDGDIIITGDAGSQVGDWIIRGAIYVGGEIDKFGENAKEYELSQEDINKLKNLFDKYDINVDPSGFKKIGPEKLRPFYKTKEESQGGAK